MNQKMTRGNGKTGFESLIKKVIFSESSQNDFDYSNDSSDTNQEDIGFIMSFDKLHEEEKVVGKKLRCDFLAIVSEIEDAIARNGKQYLKLQLKN